MSWNDSCARCGYHKAYCNCKERYACVMPSSIDLKKLHYAMPFYIGANVKHPGLKSLKQLTSRWMSSLIASNVPVQLVLRKLESLTEQECLELCRLVDPGSYGDYRYSKWIVTRDPKWSDTWKAFEVKNEKSDIQFTIDCIDGQVSIYESWVDPENQDSGCDLTPVTYNNYWQWYLERHFDMPFQPDNKTLIESGCAIDIAAWKILKIK